VENDVFTLLMRRIRDRMEAIEQSLAGGNARSYDEYCRLVGSYATLRDFEDDIKELEKRYLDG